MIKINGNYIEGGGQIIRTALALSTLTNQSFEIKNIRKGRGKPGLKQQHLTAVKTLKELCNAKVKGDELGSEKLIFKPGKIKFKNLKIDIKTAGSITLLLQSLLPVLIFSDKKLKIEIIGGTDTLGSMPVDYLTNVFLLHLQKYAKIKTKLVKRGYYPKGQGKLEIIIIPKYFIKNHKTFNKLHKFLLNENNKINLLGQGNILAIKGVSHASKNLMKSNVAERQAKTASYLLNKFDCPKDIQIEHVESLSTGSGITLYAMYSKGLEFSNDNPIVIGADALGKRGKSAEKVGKEAALKLVNEIESNAPVDKYLGDQLLPYLALFGGKFKVSKVTNHLKSNRYVIKKFVNSNIKIKKNIIEF
ncbi:RNA 3'-terminal phosphate cyclase [archaeon]|jgi:RNA 3'-terminal phosphate cyclase (GTP)|nr:RNA 3'-terminal phosphate cyclase [archaeon]MBT4022002.1 RNA 3'-terminal phosphate cyclase [archaeon]MBT4273159.1 RNA 3'-terminal phosphate cyclase [archaeon]MBT4460864.1 RNA 3'-terminal phosphate cyclase [archaeon]MBT5424301.1 RNA 3'-terminal phosphate cyclase [archaeon]